MSYFSPKPEHKFTFGLWTVGSRGADPKDATAGNFFRVLGLSQAGHSGRRSASEKRIIISNTLPQSEQRYSYKGIGRFLFHPHQDEVLISNKKDFHRSSTLEESCQIALWTKIIDEPFTEYHKMSDGYKMF